MNGRFGGPYGNSAGSEAWAQATFMLAMFGAASVSACGWILEAATSCCFSDQLRWTVVQSGSILLSTQSVDSVFEAELYGIEFLVYGLQCFFDAEAEQRTWVHEMFHANRICCDA